MDKETKKKFERLAEIRAHFVYREEFEDLMTRVKLLEKKSGIKSGK